MRYDAVAEVGVRQRFHRSGKILAVARSAADPARRGGRIAVVLGTRPEAIKLAGVVKRLGPAAWVIHTGQHYDAELGSDVLDGLGFPVPHETLGIGGASRGEQIGAAIARLDALFEAHAPIAVIVQGDTNSTLAGAVAANVRGIPLMHVEAGLRSHDRLMPEEHNRVLTDHLADLCCAPTAISEANLRAEGIDGDRVTVTGNTVVEAVAALLPDGDGRRALLRDFGVEASGFALATFHRPENVDDAATLAVILGELRSLPVPVVLPLHPRTDARVRMFGLTGELDGLCVVPPLPPRSFLGLAAEAAFWITDSGGLQEEASVLKRPVVVVRRSTERPEVQGTFAVLVPPGAPIRQQIAAWWDDLAAVHQRLARTPTPYGDGTASARAVAALARLTG